MNASKLYCVLAACVFLVLAGCGKYTITFEPANVINDGGKGDDAREMLDIDIICLTKADAEDFPTLAEGTMRSQEWFSARDEEDPRLRKLDKRIYALRAGGVSASYTLAGPPLASGRDDGRAYTVQVRHRQAGSKESAIVIFGRFHDDSGVKGLANTRPIVIHPLSVWHTDIRIGVSRTGMELLESR